MAPLPESRATVVVVVDDVGTTVGGTDELGDGDVGGIGDVVVEAVVDDGLDGTDSAAEVATSGSVAVTD